MGMLINVHRSYRNVVAICDVELYGKVFEEGDFIIDLRGKFFNGKEISEDDLRTEIARLKREDVTFNIVGERSVSLAKSEGIISEEGIKKVKGVPFALVLL